jgi:hypothetical protein
MTYHQRKVVTTRLREQARYKLSKVFPEEHLTFTDVEKQSIFFLYKLKNGELSSYKVTPVMQNIALK